MKSFLQKRDPWGHGVSLWLIAGIVFCLPLVGWSLSLIRMENDVASWLPADDPQAKILAWYQGHFPSEDRILLSWDDCSLTDPRMTHLCDRLRGVRKDGVLEGGSPYISDVRRPTDLIRRMMQEDVPFETALQRTQGLLTGRGPLCIRLTDVGRLRGPYMQKEILRLANDRFQLNATCVQQSLPIPSTEGLDIEDEASWKLHDAMTEFIRSQPLFDMQLTWPRMHIDAEKTEAFRKALLTLTPPDTSDAGGSPSATRVSDTASGSAGAAVCVSDTFYIPGTMAAVSIGLTEAGVADRKAALKDIAAAAEAVGIPDAIRHMGGRPVASAALNLAVKNAGWNRAFPLWDLPQRSPILLSGVVTILLSLVLLKSFRLAVMVQVVSIVCAAMAVALVAPTGGSMNMVLVVMPTLLVVVTTSGAIHLCNYWKNSGMHDPVASVHYASSVAWLPCFLASGTTAIGLASLTVSSLVPVRDFGIYASIGCILSFGLVIYLLPSLMLYWPQSPPTSEAAAESGFWRLLGKAIAAHRHVVCVGCLLIAAVSGYGLTWFRTETKVIRYFPDEARVVQDYNFLEENLSGIVSVDTIIKFDVAAQQLPFMERARTVMRIQEALQAHPEVSGTLSLASFLSLSEADSSGMTRMQRLQAKRRESMIGQRIHEKLAAGGAEASGLSSLLTIARESADWLKKGDAALNQQGDELWKITCQSSIMSDYDYGKLTAELDEVTRSHLALTGTAGTGHIVTGLIPVFLRTQQALLESLISSFGLAFLVIGGVMAVLFRSILAAVLAMLPNVMPVIVMFGLLAWYGIRIDIGTMITASVALGIAVDGTLHLMTWFQKLLARGMPRHEAVAESLAHCGPALWQTSAAIGLGMLALYPVELLLISRFGWIITGMIFSALISDAVLLPALLAGHLGALLERRCGVLPRSELALISDSVAVGGTESPEIPGNSESPTVLSAPVTSTAMEQSRARRPHFAREAGMKARDPLEFP